MADIIDIKPILTGFNGDPAHTPMYAIPSISMRVAEALINATWNEAQVNKTAFTAKLTAALSTWLDSATSPHVTAGTISAPGITEPNVTIPTAIDTSNIMSTYDTKYLELVAMLVAKFNDFRTTYFPDENNAYLEAENWLQAAIANPSGLPPTVLSQLLADEYARITGDKQRAQDSALAQFAARRFPLPPGAANSMVMQIEQKAQDELAEASRKLTALSVEMQKFNVEKLLGLRGMAMDSAIKYISALASGPDMASKVIGVGYDAQSKLISAASSFYNARIQAAEVTSKVAQYNNSTQLEAAVKNQVADLQMIENKLKGLLTEAQSLAQMSTALYNNLNVSANISTSGGSSIGTNVV